MLIFVKLSQVSSINRVLRNLASKSFDSASSASSSTGMSNSSGGSGSSPNSDMYDKLRLLNGGQPWSQHSAPWYVSSPGTAAAAAAAAFSQHINGQSSPHYTGGYHDPLNENHPNIHGMGHMGESKYDVNAQELKKGKFIFFCYYYY